MQYGTPIVSLQVDPDGILARQGFGYCAGGDCELLKEKIGMALAMSESSYSKMSQRSYSCFKAKHEILGQIGKFKDIVSDLTSSQVYG